MAIKLPDTPYVQHRLKQDTNGRLHLRSQFLETLTRDRSLLPPSKVPPALTNVLDDVIQLVELMRLLQSTAPWNRQMGDVLYRLADRIIGLAKLSPDGVIAAIMLGPREPYTASHAIYSALLAARLSVRMNLDTEEIFRLVCAALTMNLGLWQQQEQLGLQKGPLTSRQRQDVELHPLLSSALLHHGGIHYELLHQLVLTQHEMPNGRGYPPKTAD